MLDDKLKEAIRFPNMTISVFNDRVTLTYTSKNMLCVKLPSGRVVYYQKCFLKDDGSVVYKAYIDQEGELRDLDLSDIPVMEEMSGLVSYLEDNGARSVTVETDEDIVAVRFEYALRRFIIELDLEQDITTLSEARRGAEPLVILQLESNSFFDLLAAKGLGKIIDSRL
jgi:hypothetical protein